MHFREPKDHGTTWTKKLWKICGQHLALVTMVEAEVEAEVTGTDRVTEIMMTTKRKGQ